MILYIDLKSPALTRANDSDEELKRVAAEFALQPNQLCGRCCSVARSQCDTLVHKFLIHGEIYHDKVIVYKDHEPCLECGTSKQPGAFRRQMKDADKSHCSHDATRPLF
jgi:hypothetical protein